MVTVYIAVNVVNETSYTTCNIYKEFNLHFQIENVVAWLASTLANSWIPRAD